MLGIAACGAGRPRWWLSDGPLVPLRYFARLRELCAEVAERATPRSSAKPHRGRGASAGVPRAARARLPGDRDRLPRRDGPRPALAPRRRHRRRLEPQALDATVQFGLMLVDAIDALGRASASRRGQRRRVRPA